jgi:hypothetical protein
MSSSRAADKANAPIHFERDRMKLWHYIVVGLALVTIVAFVFLTVGR